YYERVGLLPPPARSAAGYRLYDQDAVARLRLIKGAQGAGLRLREIGELLQVADQGLCPWRPHRDPPAGAPRRGPGRTGPPPRPRSRARPAARAPAPPGLPGTPAGGGRGPLGGRPRPHPPLP